MTAATGLIVHSEYVESRIANWADNIGLTIRKVPQLRSTPLISANVRSKARKSLGLLEEDFLVISIGMIYPTKLNHLLLEAWLSSTLVADPRCHLVFVGELPGGDYGDKLAQLAESKNLGQRIIFTGFVDSELYIDYLSAADMAVQLRTDSRGETSRTVLDCLAFAIPLILNAHGTNFELPDGVAIKLSDNFTNEDLRQALERLWKEEDFRFELGRSGQKYIRHYHAPISVAKQYYDAIEHLSLNHWRKSEQRLIDYTIDLGGLELQQTSSA
ncbi:MAG: glycosyltransferase family 4 protein [Candidatus Competibacteraceae bacterium]|nr:glycosyltransferase family 4 protein [Candidatus Competibacteraceae bacterium]